MIAVAARKPREDEQAAFEVIRAVEDVVSHRWLEEGDGPTPDLEVVLGNGQVVGVEITMSTEEDRLRLCDAFNRKQWRSLNRPGFGGDSVYWFPTSVWSVRRAA